jgi:replicative DNA helicase
MSEILSDDEIESRIADREASAPLSRGGEGGPSRYQFIRPLSEAAEGLIETMGDQSGRLKFGIRDIDLMTRGIGRGELCMVTGRAHSGKTQLVLQAIANNPQGRWLYFTPDEVSELVLMKLACISRGYSAEIIEQKLAARDADTAQMIRDVATTDYPNLLVIDEGLNFNDMTKALREAEDHWGDPVDGIVVDYLELLPGDADHDGVAWKVQEMKRFTKGCEAPVMCLHQAKRGSRGQSKGLDSMRYGGENEATFVIEVYRKSQDEDLDAFEREREACTITVGVVKNKRPPCKTGEVDLFIHEQFGQIRPLQEGDRLTAGPAPEDFEVSVRAGNFQQGEL